jgi:hypothetical protein
VSQQELNLLQFTAGLMTKTGASPAIMPHAALPSLCRMPDNAESKSKATHNPG